MNGENKGFKHIKRIANAYMEITFENPVPLMVASKILEQTSEAWNNKDNWQEYLDGKNTELKAKKPPTD